MQKQKVAIKEHYKFTQEDAELLLRLQPRMEDAAEEFIDGFYDYIWGFGETATFLKNRDIIANHRAKIKEWFVNLFCGRYDIVYFTNLYKIGEVHVRIGLPTHYVNAAFTFVRIFALRKTGDGAGKQNIDEMHAVEKIIDMNLDVLTSSYREEELSKFLSMSRVEKTVLSCLKKFNSHINFLLTCALGLVAFFAIGLFSYDVYLLFFSEIGMETGILTVLGSLLVLWATIELIQEQIKRLQGKGFAIGAFIMLAMAALIRKILIYSLSTEKHEELLSISVVLVCLAIAYWLVGPKENSPAEK